MALEKTVTNVGELRQLLANYPDATLVLARVGEDAFRTAIVLEKTVYPGNDFIRRPDYGRLSGSPLGLVIC